MKKSDKQIKAHATAASAIIDSMGGTTAVAAKYNIGKGAVSHWRDRGISRRVLKDDPELAQLYKRLVSKEYVRILKDGSAA